MKILIVSKINWDNNNSFGNTLTTLFADCSDVKFAHLYVVDKKPNNNICQSYCKISEIKLLKSIFNRKIDPWQNLIYDEQNQINIIENEKISLISKFLKFYRLYLLLWTEESLWLLGKWKSTNLRKYIKKINPDIIYFPVSQHIFTNRLIWHLKMLSNAKVVLFHADDLLTFNQFSLSPFYWLNRIVIREIIKRTVKLSNISYCISEKQINEYDKILHIKNKLLYKYDNFDIMPKESVNNDIIKLVYTGNINYGRWKNLAKIGKALKKINILNKKAQLDIYTFTPVNNKMLRLLNDMDNIILHAGVTPSEVKKIQSNADILVHVESFSLKEKMLVRLSFSTKIVDYFSRSRCIFAIGKRNTASIDYLISKDSGIVATNNKEIKKKLETLISQPQLIRDYADKAWRCGIENHNKKIIQNDFYSDLKSLIN